MAGGKNTALGVQLALAALLGDGTPNNPGLIQQAENAIGTGNGQAKHDLVLNGANTIFYGVAAEAAQNNPAVAQQYAPLVAPTFGLFSTIISAIVNGRKAAGIPVQPTPTVPPVSGTTSEAAQPATEAGP